MKYMFLIFLFAIQICFAQFIPHEATLTASKDSIMSNEAFTVTYSLTGVQGHVYIGLKWGFFRPIGNDRWEGEIKPEETKTVTFTVKLKESAKKWVRKKVPLDVGFSHKPFSKRVLDGVFTDVYVNIIDFKEMKSKVKANEKPPKPGYGKLEWFPEPGNNPPWLKTRKEKVDTTRSQHKIYKQF